MLRGVLSTVPGWIVASLLTVVVTSCRTSGGGAGPPIVQPGAPGEATRVISPEKAVDLSQVRHTAADVRFMQGMIGHHAQALEMVALLRSRTDRDDMRLLARRIELSQEDEITVMQRWLQGRGLAVPDAHAHHAPGADADARHAHARGDGSPRRPRPAASSTGCFSSSCSSITRAPWSWWETSSPSPGGGQESDIFAFATDVDADQRIEMARMGAMLRELPE